MSKNYDAIVVGGGLAGLTCAAYLCRDGYRTLLCEKDEKTGGLVNTFWKNGFAFDGGIRAFENSGIVLPMLKSLGIDMEFTKNPITMGFVDEWVRLDTSDSLDRYSDFLKRLFPENIKDINLIKEEIIKVIKYMDVIYGIDNPLFLEDMSDVNYIFKTLLPWLFKFQINIKKASKLDEPVNLFLLRFTKNQSLIDMITQHFFENTPTFFALSYFGLYLDYSYPKGGTGVLAEKMTHYIVSKGGEILTKTEVVDVDEDKNEIRISNGNSYSYKKLVWAADQKNLYANLNGEETEQKNIQKSLVEKGEGGNSILSLCMGVDLNKEYFENKCGPHGFYTPTLKGLSSLTNWKDAASKGIDELYKWVALYLEQTTYEISCPSLKDNLLAPEGKTSIIVSTLLDYRLVRHISDADDLEKFKSFCTQKIQEVFETSVFPGIIKKCEVSFCITPLSIEQKTGNSQGAITGWAFTNEKMPVENRFKKIAKSIETPIRDVFQCGQWTFSPSGLPISILTGKLAADEVKKILPGSNKNGKDC